MKKLITAITASLILATGAMSNQLMQDKSKVCKLFSKENIVNSVIMNDEFIIFYTDHVSSTISKDSGLDQKEVKIKEQYIKDLSAMLNKVKGDPNDFLKQKGINAKTTWENLISNYYKLIVKTYDSKKPLSMYLYSNAVHNEKFSHKDMGFPRSYSNRYGAIAFVINTRELTFSNFIKYSDYDNKSYNELLKYLALNDIEKAYKLIDTKIDKEGTVQSIDSVTYACDAPETKTVQDLIIYERVKQSGKQEVIKDKNDYIDYVYVYVDKYGTEIETVDFVEVYKNGYMNILMNDACKDEKIYDEKLKINMKIVFVDENKKEYDRFEINKKTCEGWKKTKNK